jgi:hypothetical protein
MKFIQKILFSFGYIINLYIFYQMLKIKKERDKKEQKITNFLYTLIEKIYFFKKN